MYYTFFGNHNVMVKNVTNYYMNKIWCHWIKIVFAPRIKTLNKMYLFISKVYNI